LYVRTDLAPAVFAGMELKYSQKGARNKITPKNPDPKKYIMRLGYIDVPVFVGFRTSNQASVIGGISAGYLVHGTEYNEYGKFPPQDQVKFNSFDVQAFGGFQFELLNRVLLDLRIAYSVLPIRGQPGETYWYWLDNQFNNVISLALYYRFRRD
jgi:opacity protein-like surface antigen